MRETARRDRHRNLTEGLRCEPLLGVPLTLALLALGAVVMAALSDDASGAESRFWVVACTVFISAYCLFVAVYDSPARHAARVGRGCAHIAPRQVEPKGRSPLHR